MVSLISMPDTTRIHYFGPFFCIRFIRLCSLVVPKVWVLIGFLLLLSKDTLSFCLGQQGTSYGFLWKCGVPKFDGLASWFLQNGILFFADTIKNHICMIISFILMTYPMCCFSIFRHISIELLHCLNIMCIYIYTYTRTSLTNCMA